VRFERTEQHRELLMHLEEAGIKADFEGAKGDVVVYRVGDRFHRLDVALNMDTPNPVAHLYDIRADGGSNARVRIPVPGEFRTKHWMPRLGGAVFAVLYKEDVVREVSKSRFPVSCGRPTAKDWTEIPGRPKYEAHPGGPIRKKPSSGEKPKVMTPTRKSTTGHGELWLRLLDKNDNRGDNRAAAIILETFLGPQPHPDAVPVYKDGNRSNLRIGNLLWSKRKPRSGKDLYHPDKNDPRWARCPDFPAYEAHPEGFVRRTSTMRVLVPHGDPTGLKISILDPKPKRSYRLDILILHTFGTGSPIEEDIRPVHKDGNHTNNAVDNLAWPEEQ
jgi:hypothetical protein